VGKDTIRSNVPKFIFNLPGSFLLRIGRHSGRNSLSFNLLNKKAVEPKTRKLIVDAGEYWPVGWVYVSGL
jgi:hypothetical protein